MLLAFGAAPTRAAFDDPLFLAAPAPPPSIPPPNGYLNGPCGLAVDSAGRLYLADHYHDAVDVFTSAFTYVTQVTGVKGPCGLALDGGGHLYVNRYHREVTKFSPSPDFTPGPVLDADHATGVAVDSATDNVYVNHRGHVSAYDSSGLPLMDGGDPLLVGADSLGEGYGLAVSGFGGNAGYIYVPDAADQTVKVYDPATDLASPVEVIAGPPGGFTSLRDSSVAVDRVSGDVYVVDNLQPGHAEQPEAIVHVFSSAGAYEGHLKHKVVHGSPTGLAVDNSADSTQGRVYVTSGDTHFGGIFAYPPNAATTSDPLPPTIPLPPLGGDELFPTAGIGGPATPPSGITCEGDNCQSLPAEPVDPTLTTLLHGLGNPRVRYRRAPRDCGPVARAAKRTARAARRASRRARRAAPRQAERLRVRAAKLEKRSRRMAQARKRCRSAGRAPGARSSRAVASSAVRAAAGATATAAGTAAKPSEHVAAAAGATTAATFVPIPAGFTARVWDQRGEPAGPAGSHPYEVELALSLDQGAGEATLRELAIDLPPGLLANPATVNPCSAAAFSTPRFSPFGPSASGESCPDRSQVGTVEIESGFGGGQTRRFGLFSLEPPDGSAIRLGASPFGLPFVLDAHIGSSVDGAHTFTLGTAEVSQALEAHGLRASLWGVPWDASHNSERGNCLNESDPLFAWAKCSVGEPLDNRPLAFLTLPTQCGPTLTFGAEADSWQGHAQLRAQAVNRDEEGDPVRISDCAALGFNPRTEGLLSTSRASSPSGFTFRLTNEDQRLGDPRTRINSLPRRAVVELPDGVTLNPSLGAGLEACAPAQYAAESAANPHGAGCPNGARIGDFRVRTPFYQGFLRGAVYLAEPRRNPFDSLIAIYLVAKSAQRGMLVKSAGELTPDERDGTLTARFDRLPQLPYTDLELSLRSGQRAALVSPSRCGPATTRIELSPWAEGAKAPGGAAAAVSTTTTQIGAGSCPDGSTPPFAPGVVAGGVNSNVGSYTPYFVHLTRKDTEQEMTSYSLVLPEGIAGKLAGIPFCPEAAIAAARARSGREETAAPSCPEASRVGRTLAGYGVGSALTYAPGSIYLAGPHGGQPLSLVTVNAATVGPFDLGTVVIRSAFAVDPRTAQLQIDSRSSDPIPHILQGIPLHLRDVRIYMDRPQFTRNPTSCEASQLTSTLTGSGARFDDPADDSVATASRHFQLLNCLTLGFRPRLGLSLLGGVRRGAYPELRAVFRARRGDASLKRIAVTMPRALFLAQNHIRGVCTRVQFDADRCPAGSVYGRVVARTPLFDEPLRGPVYLRSSDSELPDLVASLKSGEVRIVLEGQIGPSESGGVRVFFDGLPDAPVDHFAMWLRGGRHGLLVNSVNVCKAPPEASVIALGQNNRGAIFTTELRGKCKKTPKKPRRGRGR